MYILTFDLIHSNLVKSCYIQLFTFEFHFYDLIPQFCPGYPHHRNHRARDITRFTSMTSENVFKPFLLQNIVQEACNSSEHKTQLVEERV